jgi:hypothetical protein
VTARHIAVRKDQSRNTRAGSVRAARQAGNSAAGGVKWKSMKKRSDETVLALLHLTSFKDRRGLRAWKAKSVTLTEKGEQRSRDLFKKYFTK